jgi:hypothetical protein
MIASPDKPNGILAQVSGGLIATGIDQLPLPGPDAPREASTVVLHPELGPVRVQYRCMKNPRRGFGNWFWVAEHAEAMHGNDG